MSENNQEANKKPSKADPVDIPKVKEKIKGYLKELYEIV